VVDDNIVNNSPTKKSYLKWLQVQQVPKGGQSEKTKQKVTRWKMNKMHWRKHTKKRRTTLEEERSKRKLKSSSGG
jgi:hypothetical protein